MGQIIGSAAKPKRCNLNKLSQLGILAAGEHVLVSYDNSMNAAGQGNFDRYIVGDGRTAATALELRYLDDSTRPYIVEEVNKAVADIQPIEITGDVTNAPDEEDLTSENQGGTDVLKFKDKAYNSALYSGLGRVYLRKNIVTLEGTGKNVLTQAMVNTANTIYHIQYDYDLNGQTITLPAGCVLEFDGGSLTNGVLNIANGLQVQGFAKIDAEVSATGAYGSKTCDVYLNGEAHKDPITYTEVRYAQKYSCVLNLAYAHNTPSRYGAKCDGVTDDTNALQCVIDVIGWDYGELDLRVQTTEGKAGFLVTSPLQIKYKPAGQDDENYKSRQRITRIFSDNYQENDNLHPTIIAKNIPAKEAALELLGYSNGVDSSTSMENIYIDASDSSNDVLSFAFMVRDSKLNVFKCCRFVGVNAVLDLSGHSANDIHAGNTQSYSKICMTWENCAFISTSETMGWSYCNGTFLKMGTQSGDNSLFLSCIFHGLSEIDCRFIVFLNCMWYCQQGKTSDTAGALGFETDTTSWKYNKVINFNDAVSVIFLQSGNFNNCYYEDLHNGIVFCGRSTAEYALANNTCSILIQNCYFNGKTNQKNNGVPIYANSGVMVNEGLGDKVIITLDNCYFRDWDTSERPYCFETAGVVNYNRYPIYCNNMVANKRIKKETFVGNIVFDNNPKFRKLPVKRILRYTNDYYNVQQDVKEGYENMAVIIGPFSSDMPIGIGNIMIGRYIFDSRGSNGYPTFNLATNYMTLPIKSGITLTDGTRYILIAQTKWINDASYFNTYSDYNHIDVHTEYGKNLLIKTYTANDDVVGKLCRVVLCQDVMQLTFDEAYALLTEGAENVITKTTIPASMKAGFSIIDNGKPIWWNGSAWVDATGAEV